jgi:O-antigen ligase
MKNKIYSNIHHVILCLFSFAIPFITPDFPYINVTPSLIALLVLIWLIEGDFANKWKRIKNNKLIFALCLCVGLYLLYLLGLLYSKNIEFGLTDLLLKLPLLILPIIIFTLDPLYWTKKKVEILLKLFVLGCLIILIISVLHSWIVYKETALYYYFLYTYASLFHHPSYASMYYCFSFVIINYLFITHGYSSWEKIIAVVAMILFFVEIILLESRAGILVFGCVLINYFFYILFFKRKFLVHVFTGMIIICMAFIGSYKLFPNETNRVQHAISYINDNYITERRSQDTYVRFLIWESSLKVGTNNLPFGVGTGDIKDELIKQYQKENHIEPYENHFNAHCQYLQVFVTLGILGTIFFLLMVLHPVWIGCKTRNILFILFSIITGGNFLVESMLERQAGVIFFVFFLTLLYFISQTQLLKQKIE